MVAGGAIFTGIEPGPTVVLVGGTLSAFLAAGTFGPTEFDGWPGVRVIQGRIPPAEALRGTLFYVIWLVLGFASGALITSLFV